MSSQAPPPPPPSSTSGRRSTSSVRRGPPPHSPPPSKVERTVKNLRLSKALTIPESTTVFDACRKMASRRFNAVLLTDSNAFLSGIVTDKDIATRVIAEGLKPEETLVSNIMTKNPIFVTSDSLALEALQKMIQGKFRHLPVVENGEVIALLDITKCLYDAISRTEKASEQGMEILKPSLSTILTEQQSKVALVESSDSVYVAAKKMRDSRVNSVVVIPTGKRIVGILTSKDILMRVVAQGLSPESILVDKVMTPNPECVLLETTILDALHIMHDGKFLHLPVLEKDGSVAACVDVLQITHAAISMVENSSRGLNDTMLLQRFWDSAFALEPPPDDSDSQSLGLENSFSFKFEDVKGRVHRFSSAGESLEEVMGVVMERIGEEHASPQIMYEDDEGDKVLITSDSDLVGAVTVARSSGQKVLRLYLDFTESTTRSLSSETVQLEKAVGMEQGGGGLVSWRGGVVVAGAVVLTSVAVVVYLKRSKI